MKKKSYRGIPRTFGSAIVYTIYACSYWNFRVLRWKKACDLEITLTQKQERRHPLSLCVCASKKCMYSIVVAYKISNFNMSNEYEKNPFFRWKKERLMLIEVFSIFHCAAQNAIGSNWTSGLSFTSIGYMYKILRSMNCRCDSVHLQKFN